MEQRPFNFDTPWQEDPNVKPDFSKFPESENITEVKFIDGKWRAFYRNDDPGEMYRR